MDSRLHAVLTAHDHVCTTRQLRAADVDEVEVARLVRGDVLVRVRRGLYVAGAQWRGATPEVQAVLRTRAMLLDRPDAAASHASAAALHGLPLWGNDTVVDLVADTPRRRRRGGVRLHPWPEGVESAPVGGQPAVPVAVAIAQMSLGSSIPALVCLDRALHEQAVTKDAVLAAGEVLGLAPRARARLDRLLDLADPGCESVGETRTRVLLVDLGLPLRSQVDIHDGDGFIGRVDFLVGERVVVEFDGMIKYGGADGRRALQAEKAREDRLRAAGYVVVRLVWSDLDDAGRVHALIQRALGRAA